MKEPLGLFASFTYRNTQEAYAEGLPKDHEILVKTCGDHGYVWLVTVFKARLNRKRAFGKGGVRVEINGAADSKEEAEKLALDAYARALDALKVL